MLWRWGGPMIRRCWRKRVILDSGTPIGPMILHAASHRCSRSTSASIVARRWLGRRFLQF
eukprot:3140817-Alexandrium_andersonii.AAC.1